MDNFEYPCNGCCEHCQHHGHCGCPCSGCGGTNGNGYNIWVPIIAIALLGGIFGGSNNQCR